MGILNLVRGLKDVKVDGKQRVGALCKNFKESFGTELRVYKSLNTGKGSRRADNRQILSSICETEVKGLTIKKSHSVGDIEDQFKDKMGIGVQIMQPDGKKFAPNKMRLKDIANMK